MIKCPNRFFRLVDLLFFGEISLLLSLSLDFLIQQFRQREKLKVYWSMMKIEKKWFLVQWEDASNAFIQTRRSLIWWHSLVILYPNFLCMLVCTMCHILWCFFRFALCFCFNWRRRIRLHRTFNIWKCLIKKFFPKTFEFYTRQIKLGEAFTFSPAQAFIQHYSDDFAKQRTIGKSNVILKYRITFGPIGGLCKSLMLNLLFHFD